MKNTFLRSLFVLTLVSILGCNDFFSPKKETTSPSGVSAAQSVDGLTEEYLNPNQGPFTVKKMLANLGLNIFLKNSEKFQVSVLRLQDSFNSYCSDLSDFNEASFDLVQSDWKSVIRALHAVEGMAFGPYTANNRQISDYVYAWPIVNLCSIDQSVVKSAQGYKVDVNSLLINQRGLTAVEYLLFDKKIVSRCNKRAYPQMVQWENQPIAKRKLDRCQWSLKIVSDVLIKSESLRDQWSLSGQNFTARLVYDQAFANQKEALNALTDAMYSLEYMKDLRLGRPLGLHKDCGDEKCADDIEHLYSQLTLEALEAQVKVVRAVFTGSERANEFGFGFDDLLENSGHSDVSKKFLGALDQSLQTIQQVKALGTTAYDQIEQMDVAQCRSTTTLNRLVPICALQSDVREAALILKADILTALSLRVPPTHQGDND